MLAVLVCLALAPVPMKKPALEFTVALDKVTYKPGDEVTLEFTLKNVSAADLWIGDGFLAPKHHEVGPERHFELHTTDATGADLLFWSAQPTEGKTAGIRKVFKLKPGDTYTGKVILTDGGFATVKMDKIHKIGVDSAHYTLKLVYRVTSPSAWKPPKDFDPELLWQGTLTSNAVALTYK